MTPFIENLTAAVDTIGVRYPGIILGLAQTQWESAEQRDSFFRLISQDGPL